MIRFIRYAFLAVVAIVLATIALANRGNVSLRILPQEMGHFFGLTDTIEVPLFFVFFGGVILGLVIGFFWEFIREQKYIAEGRKAQREVAKLEREVTKLKGASGKSQSDDVLALLE
ncbi:MAG: LapA family protein [Pseudomonadota bacterium]